MRLDISVGLNCYSELVSYAAVEEDCTSGLDNEVLTFIRLALMLYFFMVVHKAAFQTLSKAFSESMKKWYRSCWCWDDF